MTRVELQPPQVERLLTEFRDLGEEMSKLAKRRREITDSLPSGRTEGETLAFYRERDSFRSAFSAEKLKQYVPAAVLARCRVTRCHKGCGRLVPKLKPRKKKEPN